ncbi:MAG TPA: sugar transferase [Polyangiaceae bacterium]|jgi:exopolysaccharide biosynthesis polyprenyl glycosylphosphotransferase
MLTSLRKMTNEKAQKINLLADCAALTAAAVAASWGDGLLHWMVAPGLALTSVLLWTLQSRLLHHYDVWNGRAVGSDIALTLVSLAGMIGILALLRPLVPQYAAGSDLRRFAWIAASLVLWIRLTTSWLRSREVPERPVLIVGIGPLGRHTGLEMRDANDGRNVVGFLRFGQEALHDRLPAAVLGTADDVEAMLKEHVVDEVYIAGQRDAHHAEMQRVIGTCERFGIPFALPAAGFRFSRAQPQHKSATADGYIHYLTVRAKPVQRALKRAIDIAVSGVALALLSPILAGVALLVKLTSRGPVLFKQVRVGQHGRQFHMLKFRSMVINAEELKARLLAQNEQTGPVFKMKIDPRITGIGRIIRKFSIDELPQLLNVLRGEMSLVGPRPPIPSEVAKYEAWQRRRLSVRPGLTCVWQVSGRNEISFEEWMYLDMQYIDHWSLQRDLELIAKTVPVVLTGRGAS